MRSWSLRGIVTVLMLAMLAGCTWVIEDTRTVEEAAATRSAIVEQQQLIIEFEEQEADQLDCVIKGNISRDGSAIYHVPGGAYYDRTRIDLEQGERWFCSPEEAEAAGWRRSTR